MANTTCGWWHGAPEYPGRALATTDLDDNHEHVFSCPLQWLAGDWQSEYWFCDTPAREREIHGWQVRYTPRLAFVACHLDSEETSQNADLEAAVRAAYRRLFDVQTELGLAHIQRIWHWLYRLLDGHGEDQRYRVMCRGRAQAIDTAGTGLILPPATGVEGRTPGLRLHAILGDNAIQPIENPRQVSAYNYPPEHGKRAPAFARAAVCRLAESPHLLISGTASIVGHQTRHAGDIRAQTNESLVNLNAVLQASASYTGARQLADLTGIRVYVRHAEHADDVLALIRAAAPAVPVAAVHAALCRDDLLVEIEAQMSL